MDKDLLAEDTISKLIAVNNSINNASAAIQQEFRNNYENLNAEQLEIMNKTLQDFLAANNNILVSLKSTQEGLKTEQKFIQDVIQSPEPLNTIKSQADIFVEEASKYYSQASEKLNDSMEVVSRNTSFLNRIVSKFAINLPNDKRTLNTYSEDKGLETTPINSSFSEKLIEISYKAQLGISSLASRAASLPKMLENSLATNIDNKVGAISEGLKNWKQDSLENYEKLKYNSKFLFDDLKQTFINVHEKLDEFGLKIDAKTMAFEQTFDQLVTPIILEKFSEAKEYFGGTFKRLKNNFDKFQENVNSFVNNFDEQMKINSREKLKEIVESRRERITSIEPVKNFESVGGSDRSSEENLESLSGSSSNYFENETNNISVSQKEEIKMSLADFSNVSFKSRVDKQRSKLDEVSIAATAKGPSGT